MSQIQRDIRNIQLDIEIGYGTIFWMLIAEPAPF